MRRSVSTISACSVALALAAMACSGGPAKPDATDSFAGPVSQGGGPPTTPADSGTPPVSSATLPLVTPPVRAAMPGGLGGSPKGLSKHAPDSLTLDAADMKSRFFTEGPTSIFRILSLIDASITEINQRAASGGAPCLATPPVAYTLTPFGESAPFFASCVQNNGTGFSQFGQMNGSTFLYSYSPVGPVAVQVTPIPATDADAGEGGDAGPTADYVVHAWMAIADGKTTGGSYGVIELLADSSTRSFELAVAGRGFGYCGAQLKSDGTNVFEIGSSDMGSTCSELATSCVSASDVLVGGTCEAALQKFALAPLGRIASSGMTGTLAASGYPGEPLNGISLDGSPSDSTTLGPTSPTPGVAPLGH